MSLVTNKQTMDLRSIKIFKTILCFISLDAINQNCKQTDFTNSFLRNTMPQINQLASFLYYNSQGNLLYLLYPQGGQFQPALSCTRVYTTRFPPQGHCLDQSEPPCWGRTDWVTSLKNEISILMYIEFIYIKS